MNGVLLALGAAAVVGSLARRRLKSFEKQVAEYERALRKKKRLYWKDVDDLDDSLRRWPFRRKESRYGDMTAWLCFDISSLDLLGMDEDLRENIRLKDEALWVRQSEMISEEIESIANMLSDDYSWIRNEHHADDSMLYVQIDDFAADLPGKASFEIDLRGRPMITSSSEIWKETVEAVARAQAALDQVSEIEKQTDAWIESSTRGLESDPWVWEPYLKAKYLDQLYREARKTRKLRAKRKRAAAKGVRTRRRNRTAARRS
jgi:hypothetical protein